MPVKLLALLIALAATLAAPAPARTQPAAGAAAPGGMPNGAAAQGAAVLERHHSLLRGAGVPAAAVALVVQPLGAEGVSIRWNDTTPLNPASTMKLVTTYAALQLLGPAYTWKTEAYAAGALRRDVLDGDLVIRGSGDPQLVVEHLWLLLQRVRAYGIRELRGDVVLDRSTFEPIAHDPGEFDGDRLRPYNTGPDALLLNYKTVSFGFVPDPELRAARVVVMPPLAGLKVPATVRGTEGACGDWRGRLQGDFADPMAPQFRGAYPLSCGERVWHVSVLSHTQYFGAVLRALWESSGGVWSGRVRDGEVPPTARRIAVHESQALADVIRDVNKFSNNVMTRQLLLTLASELTRLPASSERGARVLRAGLAARGLELPDLVIDNGSGLSRAERISAGTLTSLLAHAFASPLMPELMSSLPVVGVDGTMRNRNAAAANAHIKTGQLADVRAIAGYVHAASGRRYVVVSIVNHPNAGGAAPAQDAVLEWLFRNG